MNLISKNVYIDKLGDIVSERDNIYHRTIKQKPADVNSSTSVDFGKENIEKDPKFKVAIHARISKYEAIFVKGYA